MAITPNAARYGEFNPVIVEFFEKNIDARLAARKNYTINDDRVLVTIGRPKSTVPQNFAQSSQRNIGSLGAAEEAELRRRYQLAGWANIEFKTASLGLEVCLSFKK